MEQVLTDLITLTGYTAEDAQTLRDYSEQIESWTEDLIQVFYNTLYRHSLTAAVFKEGERPAREDTLWGWYHHVSQGEINDTFWRWQWYVGLVHIPRGITNPFMLGMMSRVQQLFRAKYRETFSSDEADKVFGAFKRVTDVIAGLIAEGYFQSYLEAVQRTSGQSQALIERMVGFAVEEMLAEARVAKS